jgi:hypothetical protein
MLLIVFTPRAHIKQQDLALARLAQQRLAGLAVPRALRRAELAHRLLQLEQAVFGEHSQSHPETRDIGTREAIDHVLALPLGLDQSIGAKLLQVRAGEIDGDGGLSGQRLDRFRRLA